GLPGEKRCAQCGVVVYCGAACQKEHWKKGGHKKECRARTELQEKMQAATAPFRKHDDEHDAELRAKLETLNLRQLSAAGVRAACEETDIEQFKKVFEMFKEEMLATNILGKTLWLHRYFPLVNWGGLSDAQIQRKFDSGHRGLYCMMSSLQYREFFPRLRTTPKGRPMVAPGMTVVDFDDMEALATTEGPAFESTLADCGGDREAAEAKTRAYREDIKSLRLYFANLPSKRTHFVCKFSDPDSGPYADATFVVPYSERSSSSPFRTI
ncbi:MAG: zinc finger MYND domain-containing protein, partial [Planctomycetota bacterium]